MKWLAVMFAATGWMSLAYGQTNILVGSGSYASFPPPQAGALAVMTATQAVYVVSTNGVPIPTNKWWTDLIIHQYAGNMWSIPLAVSADAQGVNICNPINWVNSPGGGNPQLAADAAVVIRGQGFAPADARALNWGDWTMAFRMAQASNQFMDVTVGRGLPSVWIEFTGVQPQISFAGGVINYFGDTGGAFSFPATTNHFGVTSSGRYWGVFAPDATQFVLSNGFINVTFAGTNKYLVVSALPAQSNLVYFSQFAYAVPRNSQMSWGYDPATGVVTTSWHLATQVLKGSESRVIQGWLAHHYRNTTNNLAFNGVQYTTVRGPMKCATGTDFQIQYRFNGILPTLPPPVPLGKSNDYNAARMNSLLASTAANANVAGDTYWGGKDMLRYGQNMTFAQALGRPEFAALQNTLRTALTNWFTYTAGESARFFAAYPQWKALVGFGASYVSEQFNDHHFHYGYFTHAAALLGMYDQAFLTNFGPMLRLVAKEYANWDRTDTSFPFLRTFDVWAGHSEASGFSDAARGCNQESSSEAMQSWGGLFLLGSILGDKPMRDAGAMGYAIEATATREYWFNYYGDVWPASFTKSIATIVWDNGQDYQNYFTPDVAWNHAIEWIPFSPSLSYLFTDPAFARQDYNNMLAEELAYSGTNTISSMGSALGNYALGYALNFDPDYVAAQLDQLWATNDVVATDPTFAGATYYFTHSIRNLGAIQWPFRMDVPTSAVYYNTNSAQFSYIAYNPLTNSQLATVFSNNIPIGTLLLPARTLVNAHTLYGSNIPPLAVTATWPQAGQSNVPPELAQISVAFNQSVSSASLTNATMTGSSVTGLAYSQGDGSPVITFNINGAMQTSQTYAVTIPAGTTVAGTTNTLGSDYTFSFTTAPAPPPPPPNLLPNPGFEIAGATSDTASNWVVTQATGGPVYGVRTNSNPHSGSYNFEIHVASTGQGPILRLELPGVPVIGGAVYDFTFYAAVLAGSAGHVPRWDIQWFGTNGYIGETGYNTYTPGNNVYALISNQVTAAASATSATIVFFTAGGANSNLWATIDIDDVSLSYTNAFTVQTNIVQSTTLPGVVVTWPTTTTNHYTVQWTPALTTNTTWTNLVSQIPGDGTTNSVFDPFGSYQQKFYRVLQLP